MRPFTPEEIQRFRSNGASEEEINEYQRLEAEYFSSADPSGLKSLADVEVEQKRETRLKELWAVLSGQRH